MSWVISAIASLPFVAVLVFLLAGYGAVDIAACFNFFKIVQGILILLGIYSLLTLITSSVVAKIMGIQIRTAWLASLIPAFGVIIWAVSNYEFC